MARERGEGASPSKIGEQRGITDDEASVGWQRGTKKKLALLNGFLGGEVDISAKRRRALYYHRGFNTGRHFIWCVSPATVNRNGKQDRSPGFDYESGERFAYDQSLGQF